MVMAGTGVNGIISVCETKEVTNSLKKRQELLLRNLVLTSVPAEGLDQEKKAVITMQI